MPGKPRMMIRLTPDVDALLRWYARARAITPAELCTELVTAGVSEAVGDADLRATVTLQAGPPPDVPLAALAPRRLIAYEGITAALGELRLMGDALADVNPAAALAIKMSAARVEGHLVLLRDAVKPPRAPADGRAQDTPRRMPSSTLGSPVIDDRGSAVEEG